MFLYYGRVWDGNLSDVTLKLFDISHIPTLGNTVAASGRPLLMNLGPRYDFNDINHDVTCCHMYVISPYLLLWSLYEMQK